MHVLYVQEVVTRPKILNRTILSNRVHLTTTSLLPGHTVYVVYAFKSAAICIVEAEITRTRQVTFVHLSYEFMIWHHKNL